MSGSGGDRSDYATAVSSGGGARPGGGGGGGGGGGEDPCAIEHDAPINSPVPAVVATLSVGDVLDVVLAGSATHPVLQVRHRTGGVAGSLTHRGHLALIRCIRDGNTYVAEVVQIIGGVVAVRITRP